MEIVELMRANLLSPMILGFGLGIVATLVRSDLKFPAELYSALSIYLLLAIGLKGGAELAVTSIGEVWPAALATLALGCSIPIWTYQIALRIGKFDPANAAALAAHFGSVSAVTFLATQTYLQNIGVPFEGYTPFLVAILEVPAIVIALVLAQRALRSETGPRGGWGTVLREILAGKSIVLLVGGLAIGFLAGPSGMDQVDAFFVDPFRGVLTLFLLELGMVAARRFSDVPAAGKFLLGFSILVPVVHGVLGVFLGYLAGMSLGGATILAVLAASASYIAAPAAVRIALPEANPGYYLTASLAITFPFNLVIGIPLYHRIAEFVYRGVL